MVIGWLAVFLGALVGALSLPAWVPMILRVLLLYLAAFSVLVLVNAGVEHWLGRRKQRPLTWDFLDGIEGRLPTIRKVVVPVVLVVMTISEPTVASRLTALIGGAPPKLKFYCGDAEVVVDEKKEFKMEWIPGAGLAPPNIWVVNVGGVSTVNGSCLSDWINSNGIPATRSIRERRVGR